MKSKPKAMACVLIATFGWQPFLVRASIPIVWDTDLSTNGMNRITRVRLTPGAQYLRVFHCRPSGSGTCVEKLNATNGQVVAQQCVTKGGKSITANGWVDNSGNLYLTSHVGGYCLWKYDSELQMEIWSFCHHVAGFEYVLNVTTDACGNVVATGYTGSGSGAGSRLIKLDSDGNLICEFNSKYTNGKDEYTQGLAVAPHCGPAYRTGMDRPKPGNGFFNRGRLIGHDADNCSDILSVAVDESNSEANGVLVDSDYDIYIVYTYDIFDPSGVHSDQDRTVVQKRDPMGNIIWEYQFPDAGVYTSADALLWHTESTFYLMFHERVGDDVYPGVAEFGVDGDLLWRDTIDRPGWGFFRSGSDEAHGRIFVGLTKLDDHSQTRALALEPGVRLDIKPGSCPNSFNRNSHGVVPVALVGTESFDVTMVDIPTVRLSRTDGVGGEVAPNEGPPGPHSVFEDVATPSTGEPCDCHHLAGDGIVDLSMKFRTDDVVEILELNDLGMGDELELIITGLLTDGTEFTSAGDCILIVPRGVSNLIVTSSVPGVFIEVSPANLCNVDDSGFADFQRDYTSGTSVTLTAPEMLNDLVFSGWEVDGTPVPSVSGTVSVTLMETYTTAEAVYVPVSRVQEPTPTPTPVPRPAPRPVIR